MEQQMFTDGTTLKGYISEEGYTKTVKLVESLGLTEEEPISELPLPVLDVYF